MAAPRPPAGGNTAKSGRLQLPRRRRRSLRCLHAQREQPDAAQTPNRSTLAWGPPRPQLRPAPSCFLVSALHRTTASAAACRLGFFITTPAAEGQLELNLAEGKCPMDSTDITITLFKFDALDKKSGTIHREFRLADMLQVGGCCGCCACVFDTCWPTHCS